jgi:hypothetical protein
MKELVVFLLLHNLPGGGQREVTAIGPMTFARCDAMQRAVWAQPWYTIVDASGKPVLDEKGNEIDETDAACMPDGQYRAMRDD